MEKYGTQVRLEQDSCFLKTTEADTYTVCQFVQPGQMAGAKNVTLTFSGRLETGSESFGLFWNYAMPTVFSQEAALWLKAKEDGSFVFCLTTDVEKEKAQLYLYDECVCEMPYQECCGLSFILKNASVQLDHIRCVSEMSK